MAVHKGSRNDWLSSFEPGERRYIETSQHKYAHDMRTYNTPKSRRPASLDGMEFSASLFTAVPAAGTVSDIRYLICIQRTQ